MTSWNGYGANIEQLAKAAPMGGFFNTIVDSDGVVRSVPLLAEYTDRYYESLALAMFRMVVGMPAVEPVFPPERFLSRTYQGLDAVRLRLGQKTLSVPVAQGLTTLIPFRGRGGVAGGSFKYLSATDLKAWASFLKAYRCQDWDQCDVLMLNLQRMNPKKYLYEMYSERVASLKPLPIDPGWDGATHFETK